MPFFGSAPPSMWIGFHVLLAALLATEFLLLRKQTAGRSGVATGLWILGALLFSIAIRLVIGGSATSEFLSGYAIEEALSIDNLFVFLLLFEALGIEKARERKVLFWGILLAVVMRAGFIFAGVQLLQRFSWINYIFGLILLIAAIRLVLPSSHKRSKTAPDRPRWMKWMEKLTPISKRQDGFFVRDTCPENGKPRTMPTVLFLGLIAIGITDLVFALDSIPAVLSITKRPFVAYTSNVMAVMGLRSLFFVLTALLERLRFLHVGLAAILGFASLKMLFEKLIEIGPIVSLGVIVGVLAVTVAASVLGKSRPKSA